MPSRLFSLLLALALLWSGLGPSDPLRAVAASSTEHQRDLSQAAVSAVFNDGMIEDSQGGRLPPQAHADPSPETPGLLQADVGVALPALAMVRARTFELNDIHAPFLGRLLRPPRGARSTA